MTLVSENYDLDLQINPTPQCRLRNTSVSTLAEPGYRDVSA